MNHMIYWAAGLLEGEGSFGVRRGGCPTVQVGSTDEDTIARMQSVFGKGNRKQRQLPSGKTWYHLSYDAQDEAADIMRVVLPLMGQRRAAKIRECLTAFEAKGPKRKHWTHCSHGHELSGDNLMIVHEGKYTKRQCKECRKQRQIKYRASRNASGIFAL